MTIKWGVIGAASRIHRQRLQPAFGLAGQRIVAEGSRRGDDLSAYDEVLADPEVDAVYVPLPNVMHVEWVTKALEAGKHVLCEKPLTMSVSDTEALYATARMCGRHLSEAYMWPHHPRSQRLLELVARGELGRIQSHHGTFSFPLDGEDHRLDARGGGALFDVGIYCLGPPLLMIEHDATAVAATALRNDAGVDVAMAGWVELAPGTAATFAVSFDAANRRTQEVVGSEGTTVLDNPVPGPDRPGVLTILRRDGSRDTVDHPGANAYERMVSAFAAEVAGEAQPRWTPSDSIRLARLTDALQTATRPRARRRSRPPNLGSEPTQSR